MPAYRAANGMILDADIPAILIERHGETIASARRCREGGDMIGAARCLAGAAQSRKDVRTALAKYGRPVLLNTEQQNELASALGFHVDADRRMA